MILKLLPDKGFELNAHSFMWREDRTSVRQKLQNLHKEDDKLIEMSHFFDGDKSHDIAQKRDIYQDINGSKNYFFLNYDEDNHLCELEVHWGITIWIDTIELEFEKDIKIYLNQLNSKGFEFKELEPGNYVIEKLKITISDAESNGGTGNGLSYFYFGMDIVHLMEN